MGINRMRVGLSCPGNYFMVKDDTIVRCCDVATIKLRPAGLKISVTSETSKVEQLVRSPMSQAVSIIGRPVVVCRRITLRLEH